MQLSCRQRWQVVACAAQAMRLHTPSTKLFTSLYNLGRSCGAKLFTSLYSLGAAVFGSSQTLGWDRAAPRRRPRSDDFFGIDVFAFPVSPDSFRHGRSCLAAEGGLLSSRECCSCMAGGRYNQRGGHGAGFLGARIITEMLLLGNNVAPSPARW